MNKDEKKEFEQDLKIEKFFAREMSDEEIKKFDLEISQDEELQEKMAFEISLRRAMEKERKEEIREMMELATPPKKKNYSLIWFVIAAILAVILFFLFGSSGNKIQESQEALGFSEIAIGLLIFFFIAWMFLKRRFGQ